MEKEKKNADFISRFGKIWTESEPEAWSDRSSHVEILKWAGKK